MSGRHLKEIGVFKHKVKSQKKLNTFLLKFAQKSNLGIHFKNKLRLKS